MPEAPGDALAGAAIETFEQLAFLFAEPLPAPAPAGAREWVAVVPFSGPRTGALVLRVSDDVLAELAANMLGLDEPPGDEACRDALGEAANIVCGNVLPRVSGTAVVYALGAPVAFPAWDDALRALGEPVARVPLAVEQGTAEVALIMHPTP